MGLTEFSTIDGNCVINYEWTFTTSASGNFGVKISNSVTTSPAYVCALSRIKSTIFYMKTWSCPSTHPYFNLTTNLCQTACGTYFYANTSIIQCQECGLGCISCHNNADCTSCDATNDFREIKNLSGKNVC
jgi:hypothetical protein